MKKSRYIDENLEKIFSTISKRDTPRIPLREISGSFNSSKLMRNTPSLDYSFSQLSNCKPFVLNEENNLNVSNFDSKDFLITSLNPLLNFYMALNGALKSMKTDVFRKMKIYSLFHDKEGMNATIIEEIEYSDDSNLKNFGAVLLERFLTSFRKRIQVRIMAKIQEYLKTRFLKGIIMEKALMNYRKGSHRIFLKRINLRIAKSKAVESLTRSFTVKRMSLKEISFEKLKARMNDKNESDNKILLFPILLKNYISIELSISKSHAFQKIELFSQNERMKTETQIKLQLQKVCFENSQTQKTTNDTSALKSMNNESRCLSAHKSHNVNFIIEKYSKYLFSIVRFEDPDDDLVSFTRLQKELEALKNEIIDEINE